MSMRICPFCREKINPKAIVCRYCRRDLPSLAPPRRGKGNWVAVLTATAVIVSGAALLIADFLKERNNWQDQP